MSSSTAAKGLEGVVAAKTTLSDVRGDIGQLIYCGYDINELAGKVSYEEVVFLLHYGHLPNQKELQELKTQLVRIGGSFRSTSCRLFIPIKTRSDRIAIMKSVLRNSLMSILLATIVERFTPFNCEVFFAV